VIYALQSAEKEMANDFYALYSRMKYINRWALMYNVRAESLYEHSLDVAAIAHALAVIGNTRLGKSYDEGKAALMGMYHDMPEIITGDMPTPVKYHSDLMRKTFAQIEEQAADSILSTLPDDLRPSYSELIAPDESTELWQLVKAADKISALVKCIEERRFGNADFDSAYNTTLASIRERNCPEADIFVDEFLSAMDKDIDQLYGR